MYPFLLLLVAYVIGSVPSGLIVGRVFFNTDLRDYGSKNIGATNAYRVLGAPAGLCVLIADVGKGVLGVYLGQTTGNIYDPALTVYCMIMGGLLALIGHSASVFLHFKGGKGVATGLGIILYLAPVETAIVFFVWCVIVGLTRLVSLGSVAAALLVHNQLYTIFFVYQPNLTDCSTFRKLTFSQSVQPSIPCLVTTE